MKLSLFIRLNQMTLPALTALALTGSAWAVSPYDTAYGIQWNFMIGTSSNDASTSYIDVTNDGTIFVENRTGANTWGPGIGGGNV